uniref:Uncharacterized protein n=1 Tax=Oryctolagus cuniculus TaxID=9986 RepID=A0A5F9CHB8_RABIT
MRVQGPRDLGHLPLLSQAIAESWILAAATRSGTRAGCRSPASSLTRCAQHRPQPAFTLRSALHRGVDGGQVRFIQSAQAQLPACSHRGAKAQSRTQPQSLCRGPILTKGSNSPASLPRQCRAERARWGSGEALTVRPASPITGTCGPSHLPPASPAGAPGCLSDSPAFSQPQLLRRQVAGLQTQLRQHEARWCRAHSRLQGQIDALLRQNLQLRSELRASGLQRLDAHGDSVGRTGDPPVPETAPDCTFGNDSPPLAEEEMKPRRSGGRSRSAPIPGQRPWSKASPSAKPGSVKTDRVRSETAPRRGRGKAVASDAPDARPAAFEGRLDAREADQAAPEGSRSLQTQRGRTWAAPAPGEAAPEEEGPAGGRPGPPPAATVGPRGRLPACVHPDGRTCSVPDPAEPQDLPGKGASSQVAEHHTGATSGKGDAQGTQHPHDKVEQTLGDGRTVVTFPDGTQKETSADGRTTVIRFFNGDVKTIKPDRKVVGTAGSSPMAGRGKPCSPSPSRPGSSRTGEGEGATSTAVSCEPPPPACVWLQPWSKPQPA